MEEDLETVRNRIEKLSLEIKEIEMDGMPRECGMEGMEQADILGAKDESLEIPIHNQPLLSKPQQPVNSKPQQNILLKNWLVTPKPQMWGGGDNSDIYHTETLAKFVKNLDKENIQTVGFNNPGFGGRYPAKTD